MGSSPTSAPADITIGAPSPDLFQARLDQVRATLRDRQVDALIVGHLPNVTYLSGFSGSAGIVVLSADRLYLLIDFRYSAAVNQAGRAGALAPGLTPIRVDGSYDRQLVALLAEQRWTRLGYESTHLSVGRYDWLRRSLATAAAPASPLASASPRAQAPSSAPTPPGASTQPQMQMPPVEWIAIDDAVEQARLRKDVHEIALLREGARRLSRVAVAVIDEVVRAGRTELEIAADIDWRLRHAGFAKPAFDTIVAAGPNGALPHAVPTARPLAMGDLVVLDFGGVYGGYCVDLTRTVAIGRVSPEQRRLFDAVAQAHAAAVSAAGAPTATTGSVDDAARQTLRTHGLDSYFGHGTGHGLGLEVHEAPRLTKRSADHPGDTRLDPGMVFTIEPGAYVEGVGGVRIEDDVLVTEQGCELLTDTPRDWREL
jgi:Xaa-Pro aminopeptidase